MNRLESLESFVSVAEHRGFALAARKLGRSPSAVTRSIAALEEHLSIRLLHRTTRSVRLTDAGARYLERARRILSDLEEADLAARAERSDPAGRFAISAPSVFGRLHVAPLFCAFLRRHPGVRGELMLADRLVNLVEEGLDLSVRIGVLDDSSLRVRSVGAVRRVLVASPKYLAAHKHIRRPTDLRGHAIICFSSLSPSPEWRFFHRGKELRLAIEPSFTTNSADAAVEHARLGGGVAMILSYQAEAAIAAGALEILLPRYEPPPLPIQVVYPGPRHPSANVRAFIDFTLESTQWSFGRHEPR